MKRHAYLILAHNQWDLLFTLIKLIDDARNDIYLHIDKKSTNAPIEELKRCTRYSSVILVDRICVYRGTYSLFDAELILIKAASERKADYSYYHLLSGQDLPLFNQDYIHSFFDKNEGKNFVDVIPPPNLMKRDWYERASLYQFFSRLSLEKPIFAVPAKILRKITIVFQRAIHINRFKDYEKQGYTMCYGSNWFSITEAFAKHLVDNEKIIRKIFQNNTFAPEELIPQTFLWSSPFRNTLYDDDNLDHGLHRANMRLIVWSGKVSPETLTMEYLEQLYSTSNLFARKFDYINHPEVVEAIIKKINSCQKPYDDELYNYLL